MIVAIIISTLLFFEYTALIIFYYRAWLSIPGFAFYDSTHTTNVSVIIPARNEEQNIAACIASLTRQTYPKTLYEVIVVDDHSTDRTWEVLQDLPAAGMQCKKLKLSDHLPESDHSMAFKKLAIETAIRHSEGNLIMTSDADCVFSETWLATMVSAYEHSRAKFIAAPVKIKCQTGLLDIFQTLDFITLQGITGASVFSKSLSMCNGANLAYEKDVFYEVDGFKSIDSIPSGDDMLLMHKIFKKHPDSVCYLKNKNAIVTTQSQTSWKDFLNQRIRWASKADVFDDKRIFWVLLLVYCFNLLFPVLAIAAWWNIRLLFIAAILLVLKTLVEFLFVQSVARFFDQRHLMIYFPFLQPLHIIYMIVSGFFGKFGSYQWKGRIISPRKQ